MERETIYKHRILSLGSSYSVIFISETNGTLFINSGYSLNQQKNYLNFGLYEIKENGNKTTYLYKALINSDTFYRDHKRPSLFGYFIKEIKFEKIITDHSTKIVFILSFCRTIDCLETLSIVREIDYDYSKKVNHVYVLSDPIHFIPESSVLNIGFSHFRENPSSIQFKICNDKSKLIPFRLMDADYIANRIAGYLSNVSFNIYEEGKYSPGDNYFYTELECKYYKASNFFDDYILHLLKKCLKENRVVNETELSIVIDMGYERAYSPSFSRRLTKENDNGIRLKYLSKVTMMYNLSDHYEFLNGNWNKYKNIYEKDK
jgi:hypothetical protein